MVLQRTVLLPFPWSYNPFHPSTPSFLGSIATKSLDCPVTHLLLESAAAAAAAAGAAAAAAAAVPVHAGYT
jgi:hypothetical protein